jgi:uncharacterized protein YdhG (YjbR/CyaY superfamily)
VNREVKHYFASIPAERQALVSRLHALIIDLYPDAVLDMSYRMPTYRTKAGWVALASQKHYVSLYTCSESHLARFKKKHPAIRTGKGCINFKTTDEIPVTEVANVVKHAMERPTRA